MESEERMKKPTEAIEEKVTEEILEPLGADFKECMRRDLEAAGFDPNKYLEEWTQLPLPL